MNIKHFVFLIIALITSKMQTSCADFDTVVAAYGTFTTNTIVAIMIQEQLKTINPIASKEKYKTLVKDTAEIILITTRFCGRIIMPFFCAFVLHANWSKLNRRQKFFLFAGMLPFVHVIQKITIK